MTHIAEKASPNGLSAFHDITLKFESAIVTEQSTVSIMETPLVNTIDFRCLKISVIQIIHYSKQ